MLERRYLRVSIVIPCKTSIYTHCQISPLQHLLFTQSNVHKVDSCYSSCWIMAFSNILDYEDSLHHSIAVFNLTETDICMEVELLFVLILLSPWSVINLPCIVIYLPSMPQVELCLHSITAIICLVSFATFNCPPSCPDHFLTIFLPSWLQFLIYMNLSSCGLYFLISSPW